MCLNPYAIFLIFLASILFTPTNGQAHASLHEQHVEVALRMVGHQILLHAGDSTSRVLPVEKEEGRYRIQFDTEFAFYGEDLVSTVNRVVQEAKMGQRYIVEVEECATGEVVYSYEMGDVNNPDIVPCRSRMHPKACYSLVFTLLNTDRQVNTDGQVSFFNFVGYVAPEKELAEDNPKHSLWIALLFVLGIGIGMLLFFRKKSQPSKIDPNLIALGDYRFDKRNAALLLDHERIELSSKEADLLSLLNESVNSTLEREVILNRVWGDEGDYVGRTLDVFISKLRKKLEADPKVKIVNIRGVGYKLVVDTQNE